MTSPPRTNIVFACRIRVSAMSASALASARRCSTRSKLARTGPSGRGAKAGRQTDEGQEARCACVAMRRVDLELVRVMGDGLRQTSDLPVPARRYRAIVLGCGMSSNSQLMPARPHERMRGVPCLCLCARLLSGRSERNGTARHRHTSRGASTDLSVVSRGDVRRRRLHEQHNRTQISRAGSSTFGVDMYLSDNPD
jgi:hypothetical protein